MDDQKLNSVVILFFAGVILMVIGMLYKYQEYCSGGITMGAFIYYASLAAITFVCLVFGVGNYATKKYRKRDECNEKDEKDIDDK